ncbi:MAG TPA: hypothetical protein DDZ76_09195 [Xanthomonadales bacterium]|nr:hypothetical protein [Xanthomonadales bacterium]
MMWRADRIVVRRVNNGRHAAAPSVASPVTCLADAPKKQTVSERATIARGALRFAYHHRAPGNAIPCACPPAGRPSFP